MRIISMSKKSITVVVRGRAYTLDRSALENRLGVFFGHDVSYAQQLLLDSVGEVSLSKKFHERSLV